MLLVIFLDPPEMDVKGSLGVKHHPLEGASLHYGRVGFSFV